MVDVIVTLTYILSSKGEVHVMVLATLQEEEHKVIYAYHSALKEMNGNPCHSAS